MGQMELRMILNTISIKHIPGCEKFNPFFSGPKQMANAHSASGNPMPEEGPTPPHRDGIQPCQFCGIEVDPKGVRRTSSLALLGTKTELQILHNGEVYRLTLTRFGKLMLQK
jgi:hemin uptake protein HemP